MGGIVDWIAETIGGLIGLPFIWLDSIFGTNFFTGLIEPIMNFLGFEDEEIYSITFYIAAILYWLPFSI